MTNELGLIDETLGYYRIHDAQQIGAEATANGFIKKLTNLFYSSGHHLEKVDYLIKKQEMWAEYEFQFVKKKSHGGTNSLRNVQTRQHSGSKKKFLRVSIENMKVHGRTYLLCSIFQHENGFLKGKTTHCFVFHRQKE